MAGNFVGMVTAALLGGTAITRHPWSRRNGRHLKLHIPSLSHKRRAFVGRPWCLGSWDMPQNFLFPQRDQPLLLPVGMWEWLPEGDLTCSYAQ